MSITVHHGQMQDWLAAYDGPLFDSAVTDPPYHLTSIVKRFGKGNSAPCKEGATGAYARASKGFMGKEWDGGDVAFRPETWRAVFDKLKPGAHLVAFSGTRTFHRMVCAIEDAGFEIRDTICWHYGSGFPKSHNVSKGIDRHNGDERPVIGTETLTNDIRGGGLLDVSHGELRPAFERDITAAASAASAAWEGWGTALKPATELICLARKPLSEKSVAANVLRWGTGAINIDACRIGDTGARNNGRKVDSDIYGKLGSFDRVEYDKGRWPANLIHDGSDEVADAFPDSAGQQGIVTGNEPSSPFANIYGDMPNRAGSAVPRNDSGSAARFFYAARFGELDQWNLNLASYVGAPLSLQSEPVAFALARAAERSTQRLALSYIDFQAPNTNALASELRLICGLVTTAIQTIESECLQGARQGNFTGKSNLAEYVATLEPTGIITITISHWRSNGCADPVTFKSTLLSEDHGDAGSASRFHYSAKAGPLDRLGSTHATIKPVDLMRWLCRLVTPPGGLILEPFAGSGTTGIAAMAERMSCTMIEMEADHVADIERKLAILRGQSAGLIEQHLNARRTEPVETLGGLFA